MKIIFAIVLALYWMFTVTVLFFQIGRESTFTAADAASTLIALAIFFLARVFVEGIRGG